MGVALYNSGVSNASTIVVSFGSVGFAPTTRVKVRDMIRHKDLGVAMGLWTAFDIPSHGVAALRLSLADPVSAIGDASGRAAPGATDASNGNIDTLMAPFIAASCRFILHLHADSVRKAESAALRPFAV